MNAKKRKQIEKAILKLMRQNKLNDSISNQDYGHSSNLKEYQKCFIYIEITNTYPALTYVFNSDYQIQVGRSVDGNEICIQDPEVSRKHFQFYVYDGYLYLQCTSTTNPVMIKRGFRKLYVDYGNSEPVYHKDIIVIGQTCMQAYLIYGTDSIIN